GPLSFSLEANQSTALVGPSGAGKTSLVNTILGFMPYKGSLKINGCELSQLDLSTWREAVSWIGQNPILLHGSIRDNVTLGKHDIPDAQVNTVLNDSYAAEFVEMHGLDYSISDRSGGLSVGQAQRLALARAMLQNGRFWLLDEPTASLDARSEKLVMEGINKYTQSTTNLMITHQLAPLQNVSQILVMQDGQIVQRGDYATLASQEGLFKDMLAANLAQRESDKGNLDA
ncbi:ATP-binding cassette domain-containing protein, partial [Vibrio parahaemolyticus]|nr:ATP-binding cassette domain-containing protein [Vibrio parahaemolyticus]